MHSEFTTETRSHRANAGPIRRLLLRSSASFRHQPPQRTHREVPTAAWGADPAAQSGAHGRRALGI